MSRILPDIPVGEVPVPISRAPRFSAGSCEEETGNGAVHTCLYYTYYVHVIGYVVWKDGGRVYGRLGNFQEGVREILGGLVLSGACGALEQDPLLVPSGHLAPEMDPASPL